MDLLYIFSTLLVATLFKPVTPGIVTGFVVIFVLLCCSALLSGSEMSFFSLDSKKLDRIKTRKKHKYSLVIQLIQQPQRLLATILIANNFINVTIVIISTYITINFFDLSGHYILSFLLEFVIVTALILLFGEMLPKIYASQNPVAFAHFMAKPMNFLIKVFHPLSYILVRSTGVIEKKLAKKKPSISFDDLSDAIEITSDNKTEQQEQQILKGIVKFSDIEVHEVMKPRIDVVAVEYNIKFPQLLRFIQDAGFSRIPVYQKSFDHISGILYIKDLLQFINMDASFE